MKYQGRKLFAWIVNAYFMESDLLLMSKLIFWKIRNKTKKKKKKKKKKKHFKTSSADVLRSMQSIKTSTFTPPYNCTAL